MTADAVGGVWRYAMDLGSVLVARGVRVTIAVMGPMPSPSQTLEADRRGLAMVARPFRLEWMDEPWEDVARAGQWLLALERTIAPDVVHLNGYAHAALPWRSPTVVVAHSCVRSWWRHVHGEEAPPSWRTYTDAVSRGLSAAHCVVAPTAAMLRAIEQEYGPCPAARVIPNGIDASVTASAKENSILAAGRLWDEAKNLALLCEVAADLPWPVWVAGDVGGNGCSRITFGAARHLGCLPGDELRRHYARAAIYALPAKYEPFGLSVLEAARAGCALVLGDIPSLRENWDGAAAFVAPDDRHALADALLGLIHDADLRRELSVRVQQRSQQFSIWNTADAYLQVYDALVPAVYRS
jgi:glycogen(starch) synthase